MVAVAAQKLGNRIVRLGFDVNNLHLRGLVEQYWQHSVFESARTLGSSHARDDNPMAQVFLPAILGVLLVGS